MPAVLFCLLGLVLGAAAGFWFGIMSGLIYAEAAKVSCLEGQCGEVAVSFAFVGALGCGAAGAVAGVRHGLRRGVRASAGRGKVIGSATRSNV